MSITKNKLVDSVDTWLLKIEENLNVVSEPILFVDAVNLSANEVKEYDIKVLYPEHAGFDVLSAEINVLMMDRDTVSNTYNTWINAEAAVVVGIHQDGRIKIHNISDVQITLTINVNPPQALSPPSEIGVGSFLGEVAGTEFITGPDLVTALAFNSGVLHNETVSWLKFKLDGRTLYAAKRSVKHSVTYRSLRDANLVFGTRTVVVNGLTYKVRLFKTSMVELDDYSSPAASYDHPDTHHSEWNRLMYHVVAKPYIFVANTVASEGITEGDWASYSEEDLEFRNAWNLNGGNSWCQETAGLGGSAWGRGFKGVSSHTIYTIDTGGQSASWRPVLELVE